MKSLLLALILLGTPLAYAQQSAPGAALHRSIIFRKEEPVSSVNMPGVALAVLLLGGGAFYAYRISKKAGRSPFQLKQNDRLKLVETLHLPGRCRAYLVEADGHSLVISDGQGGLSIVDLGMPQNKEV